MVEELYIEPKEEQISGFFLDFDPEMDGTDSRRNAGNKKWDWPSKQSVGVRDIRVFFFDTSTERKKTN